MESITDSDIQYYFPSEGGIPPVPVPNHHRLLSTIQQDLDYCTMAGINPDGVTVANFDIKTWRWGIAGLQAIVKHTGTGSMTLTDVSVILRYGAFSLALDMLRLAKVPGGR